MNIVFLDLETTGRDENKHGVIEIAARYDEDRETKAIFYKKFFDEKASVNLEALKVNNTAYGSLESLGHEDVAVSAFVDFLLNLPKDKQIYLAGLNVDFDVKFLIKLLEKHNIEGLDSVLPYRKIDLSGITIFLSGLVGLINFDSLKHKSGGTLNKLCQLLDINIEQKELHTAKDDVDVTAEALYKLTDLTISKLIKDTPDGNTKS